MFDTFSLVIFPPLIFVIFLNIRMQGLFDLFLKQILPIISSFVV